MAYWTIPSTTVGVSYNGYTFNRSTTLKLPHGYRPDRTYPLVVALHSYGATAADILSRLVIDRANAFDDGVIVFAPTATLLDGANRYWDYWNVGDGSTSDTTDFNFLRRTIEEIRAKFSVNWVWLAGYSNGGFMAIQLSIQNPSLIHVLTTFATGAGTNDSSASTGTPIPHMHAHGTLDGTVNPAGDASASTLPGILAGHGGVGSSGYTSTANTVSLSNSRNGGAGSLGSPGTAFDFFTTGTPTGTGAESAAEAYSGTTSQTAVERWLGTDVNHGINLSATSATTLRGVNILYPWVLANHRTP